MSEMVNLGVLASGRGSNLQAIIAAIGGGRLDAAIKVVISDHPGAKALERAGLNNIPARVVERKKFSSRDGFDEELISLLKDHGVELVVLAGFMRILSPGFIDAFPQRIINIHPSLLPSFTGLDVHRRAIDYGVRFSGCTVHFVDKEVDTGPVIIQAVVPVIESDTPEELAARILKEEHRILPQALRFYAEGRLRVEGRRVFVDASPETVPGPSMENPAVTIFKEER